MAVVLLFRDPLAALMGASRVDPELHRMTSDYLAGFVVGAPGSMGALILIPFLQIAGQSNLLIVAVLAMTVSDIALDLLNALVLHWGMFGMGLASSLSYYVAMIFAAFFFLSKKSPFRFSRRGVTRAKILELFRAGFPTVFSMASSVVLVFAVNRILRHTGGTAAVAAFTVIMGIGNTANCIATGIGGVSLTISGVLYNEEDRHALRSSMNLLCRYSVILGLAMGVLLLACAPLFVDVFIPGDVPERGMAILGLRLFALGMIPCCINNVLKNMYQSTERVRLTEIISLLEGAFLPVLVALVLSFIFGTTGVWFYFVLGELLTLLVVGLIILRIKKRPPWSEGAAMLLRPDFGVRGGNLLEISLGSAGEIPSAVRRVESFCHSHRLDDKTTNHIALCVEEMASNVINHGFTADSRPHHLFIRLLTRDSKWVLRFRDDCTSFDPVHYVPTGDHTALGLKIIMAMASEVRYTNSLNMNNLMIRF